MKAWPAWCSRMTIGLIERPIMIMDNSGYDSITGDAIGHINIDWKWRRIFSFDASFQRFVEWLDAEDTQREERIREKIVFARPWLLHVSSAYNLNRGEISPGFLWPPAPTEILSSRMQSRWWPRTRRRKPTTAPAYGMQNSPASYSSCTTIRE